MSETVINTEIRVKNTGKILSKRVQTKATTKDAFSAPRRCY